MDVVRFDHSHSFAGMNQLRMQGNLKKMRTDLAEPISYIFRASGQEVLLNTWIGKKLKIRFTGRINCVVCGRLVGKPMGQGFCFDCFSHAPENSECIVRPELCRAHLGEGRDPEWEQEHHNQPHVVYLAKSSRIKVGVTRASQVPFRWIDQGASEVIVIADAPCRKAAGDMEVFLKGYFSDKTAWQRMLKGELSDLSLSNEVDRAIGLLSESFKQYVVRESKPCTLHYPLSKNPDKVKSINLMRQPELEDILVGIKGQYLIFENNAVLNVRNHSGFYVVLEA